MKKIFGLIFLFLVLFSRLYSEGPNGDRGGDFQGRFNLTDAQVTQLKEIFERQMKATEDLIQRIKANKEALREKLSQGATGEVITNLVQERWKLKKELKPKQQAYVDEARKLLTPEQTARFLLARVWPGIRGGRGIKAFKDATGLGKD